MILKFLVETLYDLVSGFGEQGVKGARVAACAKAPDLPSVFPLGGRPVQLAVFNEFGEIGATALQHAVFDPVGPSGKDCVNANNAFAFTRLKCVLVRGQLDGVERRLVVEEFFKQVFTPVIPIQRIGAQANAHAELATFLGHPCVELPPVIGKNRRLLRIRRPSRAVSMGVVHLHATDALLVQLTDLPQKPVFIEVITCPPPEGHLPITSGWILEPRKGIKISRPTRVAGSIRGSAGTELRSI